MNAHYYSVLTTPFDMVNAHYVIIDFRAKFFIKIQNQASDTSRSLPSFSSAPFLLRAVPSERLGQVYLSTRCVRNRLVVSFSTSCNNAVIISSCYKVVTHNLLNVDKLLNCRTITSCWPNKSVELSNLVASLSTSCNNVLII